MGVGGGGIWSTRCEGIRKQLSEICAGNGIAIRKTWVKKRCMYNHAMVSEVESQRGKGEFVGYDGRQVGWLVISWWEPVRKAEGDSDKGEMICL